MVNQTLVNESIDKISSFGANTTATNVIDFKDMIGKPTIYASESFVTYCKNECYQFLVNTEVYQLYIIFISLLTLFIAMIIYNFSDQIIEHLEVDEDKLTIIYRSLNLFAVLLLLGFMIYELWFK